MGGDNVTHDLLPDQLMLGLRLTVGEDQAGVNIKQENNGID